MTYFVFGKLHFSFRILGLNRKKHTAHFRFLKVGTKFYIRWLEKSLIAGPAPATAVKSLRLWTGRVAAKSPLLPCCKRRLRPDRLAGRLPSCGKPEADVMPSAGALERCCLRFWKAPQSHGIYARQELFGGPSVYERALCGAEAVRCLTERPVIACVCFWRTSVEFCSSQFYWNTDVISYFPFILFPVS